VSKRKKYEDRKGDKSSPNVIRYHRRHSESISLVIESAHGEIAELTSDAPVGEVELIKGHMRVELLDSTKEDCEQRRKASPTVGRRGGHKQAV
jgi:hypothetical protein